MVVGAGVDEVVNVVCVVESSFSPSFRAVFFAPVLGFGESNP